MVDSSLAIDKRAIRKRIRALRDAMPLVDRARWSAEICLRASTLPAYQAARTIHIFLSFQSEVDTGAIIHDALRAGKRVVVPYFPADGSAMAATMITTLDDAAFDTGLWGTRTPKCIAPIPVDEIDVVFAPLLAYQPLPDGRAIRLGYGKGHYDGFLPALRADVPVIGLAFACQAVASAPREPHDVLLDAILVNYV